MGVSNVARADDEGNGREAPSGQPPRRKPLRSWISVVVLLLGCNGSKAKLEEAKALEAKADFEGALAKYEEVVKATEKEPQAEEAKAAQARIAPMKAAIAVFTDAKKNVELLAKDFVAASEAEDMTNAVIGEPPKYVRCPPMKPIPSQLSQFAGTEESNPLSFYGPSHGELKNETFKCAKFDLPFGAMRVQYEVAAPTPDSVEFIARRPLPDGRVWEYKVAGSYDKNRLKLAAPVETRK